MTLNGRGPMLILAVCGVFATVASAALPPPYDFTGHWSGNRGQSGTRHLHERGLRINPEREEVHWHRGALGIPVPVNPPRSSRSTDGGGRSRGDAPAGAHTEA